MRKCRHVGKDTKAKWANLFIRSNSFVRSFSSLTCCCWFWRLKKVLELITAVMVTSSHICATGEVMTACSYPQCAFHSLWLPSTIASCTRFCLIDWEHEFALSPSDQKWLWTCHWFNRTSIDKSPCLCIHRGETKRRARARPRQESRHSARGSKELKSVKRHARTEDPCPVPSLVKRLRNKNHLEAIVHTRIYQILRMFVWFTGSI